MPAPKFVGFDNNGLKISGGKLCTYVAGTSTPQATYSDVLLMSANTNPVILDPAGRATVFLSAASYKFVLRQPGTTTDCTTGTILWTQDNISAVPVSSANTAVLGTAGVTLTAGQVVYLSDGSGAKTAGQWFAADSTNTYSSLTPTIGMVQTAITSGNIGTITLGGSITALSGLIVGTSYYVSTAGTLTATAPTNARVVGQADTTTTLVLTANPPVQKTTNTLLTTPTLAGSVSGPFLIGCGFRLTLTSGTAVTTSDVTGAASVFVTPYSAGAPGAGACAFYDGSATWTLLSSAEVTVPLGTLSSGLPYDIFCFNNSGVMACDAPVAWTNGTTRATALALQNGVYVKSGTTTRRYLGSFYTSATTTTEDSARRRLLFSYYNRLPRTWQRLETTATWTYTTAAWRQMNGSATNQVETMVGVAESPISVMDLASNSNGSGITTAIAVGDNSTTTPSPGINASAHNNAIISYAHLLTPTLIKVPAVGFNFYAALEWSAATGTTTWQSNGGTLDGVTAIWSGLVGMTFQ